MSSIYSFHAFVQVVVLLFHELVGLLLLAPLPGFLNVLQLLGPLKVFHLQRVTLLREPPRVHRVDAVIVVAIKL